ncbi:MAG TPA: FtsX-like permease family protein [Syntrophorhabdales bacterium]|nr:FtsX-like permease family protein [Syntrophorhabdales bacterium]
MKKWTKLALRNILRNKRRSLVTLLAIGVGFAAITLFHGYVSHTYWGLRESAVQGEGLGHLTIYKAGWLDKGKLDPERYMFSREEIGKVTKLVEEERDVVLATPQIQVNGLVSNGIVSTIFIAQGVIPRDDRTIRGTWEAFRPINGEALSDKKSFGVEVTQDLAKYLNLSPGKDAVVMTSTLSGQMNAMDMQVSGVYDSGSDATNDKYLRFTFDFAQSLYDTKAAEKIVVLLDDWQKTESMRTLLSTKLAAAGIPCEIKTWNELSLFYSKVRGMFGMIFLFIFCIVLVIVIMSTVNTMGMAVLERTREIGTLRALGLKKRGVSLLFALEGGLLGLIGSLIGTALHVVVWAVVRRFPPTYTPPGLSTPVPLTIDLVPQAVATLVVCLILLSLIAAIIPARHAAKQNVVTALGHT